MSQIDSPSANRAKDRAEYYKEQQRAKEQYNSDLSTQEMRYDKSVKEKNDKYHADISEIKDRYDKKFDDLRSKSNENSKKYQGKVEKQTKQEQEQNLKSLSAERENFQRRVEDLNLEYNKEMSAKDKRYASMEDQLKTNFKDNLAKKEETFTDHTNDLRQRQDASTEDLMNKSKSERNDLEKKYTGILSDKSVSELKKRQLDNNAYKTTLDKSLADSKLALKLQDESNDAEVSDIRRETNSLLEKNKTDEKINYEKALATHNRESANERDAHRREIGQVNMDHLMEKRLNANKESRKAEAFDRAQQNDISVTPKEKDQEAKIRNLKERNRAIEEKLSNQQDRYSENAKLTQRNHQVETANALQKKELESDNKVMDILGSERSKFDKSKYAWQNKTAADKEIYDRMNIQNEKALKTRVTNLNESYSQKLNDLNDRNTNLLAGMKRDHLQDKRDFSKTVENQFNQRQIDLVRNFEHKQDVLMTEYEKKITELESQNQELMNTMQASSNRIRSEGNQKLQIQQDLLVEQKKDSERALHEQMATREKDLHQIIDQMHEEYSKRINDQEKDFKLKISELTNNYEQKIFHLKTGSSQELNAKNVEMVKERKLLLSKFEDDKKRLSEQYEEVIKSLKVAHEERMLSLSKFKKMDVNTAS